MYVIYQNEKCPEIICVTTVKNVADYMAETFNDVHYKEVPYFINHMEHDLEIIRRLDRKKKEKS